MASVNLLDENLLLWNNFRSGNADAFGELMRTHYPDLFNYGARFTKDTDLVKECIQDIFLCLWVNRLSISETSFVKYYLLKSLRHYLTRSLNNSRRRTEPAFEYLFGNTPPVTPSNTSPDTPRGTPRITPPAGEDLIREEQHAELANKMRKSLAGLSCRQQEVIYLRFCMDADTDEIAEIMTLNRQSVYQLLHDALRRLRKSSPKKNSWFPHLLPLFF